MIFNSSLIDIIYMIPVVLLAISVHECGHSMMAYYLGDKSQILTGRMTLNPFMHIDIFGFIALLCFGIGWGKPVSIDEFYFKDKRKGTLYTALAGPVMNIITALLITILIKIFMMTGILGAMKVSAVGKIIYKIFILSIQFNVFLAVFNLLPLPVFDGGKVLMSILPAKYRHYMVDGEKYMFWIILFLAFTGILNVIITPMCTGILWLLEVILNL